MNRWAKFNTDFFKDENDINWFDRTGVLKLTKDLRASVTLSTNGHAEHYVGYKVKIINRNDGVVHSHFFNFNEYLDIEDSVDGHSDTSQKRFEIISYCCKNGTIEWYIRKPHPIQIAQMVDKIKHYIEQWR